MSDTDRSETQSPSEGGIFGNLPRSRPGVRSPRREPADEHGEADRAAAKPRPARATSQRRPPVRPRPAASPPPPPPSTSRDPSPPPTDPEPLTEDEAAGLEELAWAGVTVAAEAATVGVRLVSRMLEAAREAVERR